METILAAFFLLPVAIIAFGIGQWTKEYPSEDEMIKRLVSERVERKLRVITEAQLDREIDASALRIVAERQGT